MSSNPQKRPLPVSRRSVFVHVVKNTNAHLYDNHMCHWAWKSLCKLLACRQPCGYSHLFAINVNQWCWRFHVVWRDVQTYVLGWSFIITAGQKLHYQTGKLWRIHTGYALQLVIILIEKEYRLARTSVLLEAFNLVNICRIELHNHTRNGNMYAAKTVATPNPNTIHTNQNSENIKWQDDVWVTMLYDIVGNRLHTHWHSHQLREWISIHLSKQA